MSEDLDDSLSNVRTGTMATDDFEALFRTSPRARSKVHSGMHKPGQSLFGVSAEFDRLFLASPIAVEFEKKLLDMSSNGLISNRSSNSPDKSPQVKKTHSLSLSALERDGDGFVRPGRPLPKKTSHSPLRETNQNVTASEYSLGTTNHRTQYRFCHSTPLDPKKGEHGSDEEDKEEDVSKEQLNMLTYLLPETKHNASASLLDDSYRSMSFLRSWSPSGKEQNNEQSDSRSGKVNQKPEEPVSGRKPNESINNSSFVSDAVYDQSMSCLTWSPPRDDGDEDHDDDVEDDERYVKNTRMMTSLKNHKVAHSSGKGVAKGVKNTPDCVKWSPKSDRNRESQSDKETRVTSARNSSRQSQDKDTSGSRSSSWLPWSPGMTEEDGHHDDESLKSKSPVKNLTPVFLEDQSEWDVEDNENNIAKRAKTTRTKSAHLQDGNYEDSDNLQTKISKSARNIQSNNRDSLRIPGSSSEHGRSRSMTRRDSFQEMFSSSKAPIGPPTDHGGQSETTSYKTRSVTKKLSSSVIHCSFTSDDDHNQTKMSILKSLDPVNDEMTDQEHSVVNSKKISPHTETSSGKRIVNEDELASADEDDKTVYKKMKTSVSKPDKIRTLYNWYFTLSGDGGVHLEGFITDFDTRWQSSAIVKRIDSRTFNTESNSLYHIQGPIHRGSMKTVGFSKQICDVFDKGFPTNWETILESFVRKKNEMKAIKVREKHPAARTTSKSAASRESTRPSERTKPRHDNSNKMTKVKPDVKDTKVNQSLNHSLLKDSDYQKRLQSSMFTPGRNCKNTHKNLDLSNLIEATKVENHLEFGDLPTTRSGRRVKPLLAWWAGQRFVQNVKTGEMEIVSESPNLVFGTAMYSFKTRNLEKWREIGTAHEQLPKATSTKSVERKRSTQPTKKQVNASKRTNSKLAESKNVTKSNRRAGMTKKQKSKHSSDSELDSDQRVQAKASNKAKKSQRSDDYCDGDLDSEMRSNTKHQTKGKQNDVRVYDISDESSEDVNIDRSSRKRPGKKESRTSRFSDTGLRDREELHSRYSMRRRVSQTKGMYVDDLESSDEERDHRGRSTERRSTNQNQQKRSFSHDDRKREKRPQKDQKDDEYSDRSNKDGRKKRKSTPQSSSTRGRLGTPVATVSEREDKDLLIESERSYNQRSSRKMQLPMTPRVTLQKLQTPQLSRGRRSVKAEVESASSEAEEMEEEDEEAVWTRQEITRYNKAMKKTAKNAPSFWGKIAKEVKSRTAEECRELYEGSAKTYRNSSKKPSQSAANRPRAESANTGLKLTGGKGTMKRRNQLKELLMEQDRAHREDLFDSTPLRTQAAATTLAMGDSDDDDDYFNAFPRATYRTPVVRPSVKPDSHRKTPAANFLTPGLLRSVQKSTGDICNNKLLKLRKGRKLEHTTLSHKTPSRPKSIQTSSSGSRPQMFADERLFDEPVHVQDDDDSCEELDFYWSETSD